MGIEEVVAPPELMTWKRFQVEQQGLLSPEGTRIKRTVICLSIWTDGVVSVACLMADEWWYARILGTQRKLGGGDNKVTGVVSYVQQ